MLNFLRNYFKKTIDLKYPNWDLTIALRYLPIIEDLKKNYRKGDTILELGSEITGITTYFKKKVTGVDISFDYSRRNKYLTPIYGSVLDLPFVDESFDFVLSVDMLEHISPKLRAKAIKEMVRVTKEKMYLSFPGGKTSESVDKELDEYFFKRNGEHFPYLVEHVDLGLPSYNEVRKLLLSFKQFRLKEYNNTNVYLWKILLEWGLSGERLKSSLYRRALLLIPILKHFNFGTTYRKVFILERIKV